MALRNLIHGGDGKRTMAPAVSEEPPIQSIERQMNRALEQFFNNFGFAPWSLSRLNAFRPRVNVAETEKEITVTAELPGLEEKDIDLTLTRNSLIIKGLKSEDRRETQTDYQYMERSYGEFQRVIPLPGDVDVERAEAKFTKGVLSITLPKIETEGERRRKIPIKGE
jgi:HSP20 family protein